ncbi:DUF305 domain-containing protein [Micromonospora sp. NPDC049274]|uniref:DUF305 domain-containing protein n=1 Tax=Micromonospora sp. NPDC049274 TaxID=3154829 RepID=UPI00342C2740
MRAHVALLTAAVLLTGCAGGSPGTGESAARPTVVPPTVASTPSHVSPAGAFSPTDIAWLQLTAAMTDRLLTVLNLVPSRTTDPTWRRLAAEVRASNRADLTRSRELLGEAGAPTTNPHEGHDMPGMVTTDELNALRSSTGQPFLRLFAEHLRAYLAQSVRVATAERQGGVNPATIALATSVIRRGTAELEGLGRLDRPPSTVPANTRPAGATASRD